MLAVQEGLLRVAGGGILYDASRLRKPGAEVFVERKGSIEPLRITTVRFHRDRRVFGFYGFDTMNDADALAGY